MERAWLASQLEAGRSYESIAQEAGRHASTVSYWARKYGLASSHVPRHAARGEIERWKLERAVACGLSVREIGTVFDRSTATVRHWLDRHGLVTSRTARHRAGRAAVSNGQAEPVLDCPAHGPTRHVARSDGRYRCVQCRADQVAQRRRTVKQILVHEAGGRCARCGYDEYIGALQFHHVDPKTKEFAISRHGVTRSIADARAEAAKCVLLCGNCHAAIENGGASMRMTRVERADYPG
jgi:transposase